MRPFFGRPNDGGYFIGGYFINESGSVKTDLET